MPPKTLSVIVPVYNISEHVDHLKAELAKLPGDDAQIIVVDDGSTDKTVEELAPLEKEMADFKLIKCLDNAGAGVARNVGFPHATGKYTLFFDGDDDLHVDAIYATIALLDRTKADVSINTYDFFREGDNTNTGMNSVDQMLWDRFFMQFQTEPFALSDAKRILGFTNYPWNKIIRTAHYKHLNISPLFGETKVNNDILGHWNLLLNARMAVLVEQNIVTHHVSGARNHISKNFGKGRLELFSALEALHHQLKKEPRVLAEYGHVYWTFVRTLVVWAQPKMREDLLPEFRYRRRELTSQASLAELSLLEKSGDTSTLHWLAGTIA